MNPQYLLYYNCFLLNMGFSLVAPIIPKIIEEKGGTAFISGLFIGAFNFSQLFAIIYSPKMLKIFGRKNHFIYFVILQTVSILLYSILNSLNGPMFFIMAFLIRMCHGFSDGSLVVPTYGTTNIISRGPNLEKVIAMLEFIGMAGATLGPLIIGFFYKIGGYAFPFIITTILSGVAVVGLIKVDFNIDENAESANNNNNNGGQKLNSVLPFTLGKNTSLIIITGMINFNGHFFYYPTLTNHLKDQYNIPVEISSSFFIIPVIGYCIGLYNVNKVLKKFDKKLTILIGCSITIIACLFAAPINFLPQSSITIGIGLLIMGFGEPFVNIPIITESTLYLQKDFGLSENDAGDISGSFYILSWNVGTMLCTPISGFIKYKINYPASAYFCIILSFFIIIYYYKRYKSFIDDKINQLRGKTIINQKRNMKENFLENIEMKS